MLNRRQIIAAGGAVLLGNLTSTLADIPATPELPPGGYRPVVTPNGVTLPFKLIDGVKVFHLIAEEVEHEFMPGLKAHCWGYNGRTVGPTIEAVTGDRVRFYVTNKLPEATTVHWHGLRIPNGMDGVNGLTQPPIPSGETWIYEFDIKEPGTFMYHPHLDEMTQQAMGMMGMFIVHAKTPTPVDRDYVLMLSEWRVIPGTSRPVTTEMLDFNLLTINSRVYPATDPLIARTGERVRIRFGNLSAMDHHPMHLHGFQMVVTETDGGIVPKSAQYPANTVLVPVGSTRTVEFTADAPGDWPLHCHMTHHTMNQMGHEIPNVLGIDTAGLNGAVRTQVPGYMTMGQNGMDVMSKMQMRVPPNSRPMSGGTGQFGTVDMGGMFTVLKVRDDVPAGDVKDVPDYKHPAGTVCHPASDDQMRRDGIA